MLKLDTFPTPDNSAFTLKYPETLISWTMHFLKHTTLPNPSIQSDFVSVAKQCVHHPNTLYRLIRAFSDYRAWDLLRRILDEKGFVQEHLPHEVVSWITEESRQEVSATITSNIDEIEQEVNEFHQRMEHGQTKGSLKGEVEWTKGWKKWEGEWIPRPIGFVRE
jgi:hypothetical protein